MTDSEETSEDYDKEPPENPTDRYEDGYVPWWIAKCRQQLGLK